MYCNQKEEEGGKEVVLSLLREIQSWRQQHKKNLGVEKRYI